MKVGTNSANSRAVILSPKIIWHHLALPTFTTILLFIGLPNQLRADSQSSTDNAFFQLSTFGSVASDIQSVSNNSAGFGWVAQGGYRMERLGLFVECQRDLWVTAEQTVGVANGVLNIGIGAHYLLFSNRVKISVATGTSTLLFDTIFDSIGTTGFYLDVHPTTLRWPLTKRMVLELSPLSFTLLVPVMSEPVLKRLEYRTSIGVEVTF